MHSVTDIHWKLQEEHFISHQALMRAQEGGLVSVHFLPEAQYPNTQAGTGKFICKPSILDENKLIF